MLLTAILTCHSRAAVLSVDFGYEYYKISAISKVGNETFKDLKNFVLPSNNKVLSERVVISISWTSLRSLCKSTIHSQRARTSTTKRASSSKATPVILPRSLSI